MCVLYIFVCVPMVCVCLRSYGMCVFAFLWYVCVIFLCLRSCGLCMFAFLWFVCVCVPVVCVVHNTFLCAENKHQTRLIAVLDCVKILILTV